MSLELLKNNVNKEKEIIKTLIAISERLNISKSDDERKLLFRSEQSLLNQLRMINDSLPDLLKNISFYNTLSKKTGNENNLVALNYLEEDEQKKIAIKKKDKDKFLSNVVTSNESEKKLKPFTSVKELGAYAAFSNKMFSNISNKLADSSFFSSVKVDLKKITSPILVNTFISVLLMSTAISFIAAFFIAIIFIFLGLPLVALGSIIIPVVVFSSVYLYPPSQKKSLEKEINQELPFLTIYLSAISTSGIEPSKIFEIIASSKDYPFTQREIKKLINYVNFYGYDLVSALKMVSRGCPSERLALLFDGLATTITSGGELNSFLNKHSETLLFDYRLEREKYTRIAETFMDIYISVIIAAPMILMMLFVLMSITGFSSSMMNPSNLSFLVILIIGALNVGFLMFLNLKQPKF
jgi:Flp pilus assembly protein TadB